MQPRPYEKLIVWKESYNLCLLVYRVTADFPSYERFGLTSQLRRGAHSIPLNIAEGNSKRTEPDKVRYLDIARGSLEELHCATRLCRDLEYISGDKFDKIDRRISKVSFLLARLRAALVK